MMSDYSFELPIDPADVDRNINRLSPPRRLFNQNGTVTDIYAAYEEPETGDEIPVGAVITRPEELTVHTKAQVKSTDVMSVVVGCVGDTEIYKEVSWPVELINYGWDLGSLSGRQIAETTRQLQTEAAMKVLAHLGLDYEDLLERRRQSRIARILKLR
jgi:hypothetical protein